MTLSDAVYLIDGTAYIHRAYHAIQSLSNSKGLPTNAVFGFTRMLIKLMEERRPTHAAMFFDARGPTFRHRLFPGYKANRPPMPEEMAVQIPYVKDITAAYRLPIFEMEGFEADDLIGTFSRRLGGKGHRVVVVTGDKDFLQLVSERISLWDPMKETSTDVVAVKETMGVDPIQMVDVMGLSGDATDNIPGVPGIGPKTALELIQTFGTLENLYAHIDRVTRKKQHENLLKFRDQAFLSRDLAAIRTDVPVEVEAEALAVKDPDSAALSALFRELEFRQLQQSVSRAPESRRKEYRAVMDEVELAQLIERLKAAGMFAIDTETTSRDPMRAGLVGLSASVQADQGFYIPCGHRYFGAPKQLESRLVLEKLKPVLQDRALHKIGQNIKYDGIVLARLGIALEGVVFDTMLASYLLDPSKRAHSLDQIALDFLDHKTIAFEDLVGKRKGIETFAEVPVENAVPYACEDADITRMAYEVLARRLDEAGLTPLMTTVEMPLVPVLMRMEMRGVAVDIERLHALSRHFAQQLEALDNTIYRLAGERFNIHSSRQLGYILFEKLKLPVQKKTRKKTAYSTDVDVLTALAAQHELPAVILRQRTLAKLKSTYADALIELVHPDTGRIHTSYHQTATATGRLSSTDPNLQNIPIRSEEGREIRRAFVSRPGWLLLSADYSQVELRILAHCSKDEILIHAFREEEDIHTRTASEVFQIDPRDVSAELRRQAKAINFGIIYGMSAFGLSRQLEISQTMAKTYIDHYFARHPGVKRFMDHAIEEARQTRRTSTLLGRIRLLPDIHSPNPVIRQAAERIAINTPIQGSAADLIKLAMIRIDAALKEGGFQAAMILTVHDELVFEVPPEEIETATRIVKGIMEGVWDLRVPLRVNTAAGSNWAEAH